ncbi:hypothetical protein Taro_015287, partial [Colocasia esculenta]|nr:hypothetical protein [Colocasia esculenta]
SHLVRSSSWNQLGDVLGKGSYGAAPPVIRAVILKSKLQLPFPVQLLKVLPMSQRGEGEDSLMAEDRLNGMNCSARSLSKGAYLSNFKCPAGNSLRDTADDIQLSKYSSTASVAMLTKNIYSSDSEKEDEAWQSILEEDNRLACLHEKTGHSLFSSAKAEARRRQRGDRDKAKPKFSIRFQTHKKELYSCSVVKTENEESSMSEEEPSVNKIQHGISAHSMGKGNIRHGMSAHSMAGLLEELQHENREVQESGDMSDEVVSLGKRGPRYSMSNLLEDLEKESPFQRRSKEVLMSKNTTKVRKAQIAGRTTSQLGKRSLDDEDGPELLGSRTSSEDEDNDKNNLILATMTKGQTMADIFQEVFSISTVDAEEVPLATRAGIGYYGRLQQIMQRDKDRQMEFFKQLESNAKLTVCHCLLGDKTTGSQNGNSPKSDGEIGESTVKTIIFSSRVCRNVELEVGNVICIYAPWKEVWIGDNDSIILCTYFSQLMP